jgi:hypothetical protein
MELPESYFRTLALGLVKLSLCLALLAGLCSLGLRWISKQQLAAAFRWILLTAVYVFTAALVLNAFMSQWGFRGENSPFGFERMLSYSAERPYVYRVLSPTVINAAAAMVPDVLVADRQTWLLEESPLLRYRQPQESWSVEKSVKWHVAYFYLFACLLGVLYAARVLTRSVYDVTPLFADFAPIVALLFLPLTFHFGGYLYDFAELALMLLCLIALVKSRLTWFYPLYLLAILNKESNVLISVFFFAVMYDALPRKRLLAHCAVQVAAGALILLALRIVFLDNGGSQALLSFPLNLLFWLSPSAYWNFITPYAPLIPVPRGANLISLFLLVFLVSWAWSHKPGAVRRLVLLSAACNLPLFLLFAFLDEIRNLSITFPAIYLVGCHTVHDVYGRLAARSGES